MTWLESIIYGIVSGLAEFLPISSSAHQLVMLRLFGVDGREPIRDLLVHVAILLAVSLACRSMLLKLYKESKASQRMRSTGNRLHELRGLYDLRLVKAAAVPMLIGMLLYLPTSPLETKLPWVIVFVILNGLFLMLPERIRQGNKDARSMSALESVLIGLSGPLSAFPGISRVGASLFFASLCGADRRHALNWSLLLSLPALILLACFDVVAIITVGVAGVTALTVLGYILSALGAFAGGYLSVVTVRSLLSKNGAGGLSYYCWGVALFLFVLYLIV